MTLQTKIIIGVCIAVVLLLFIVLNSRNKIKKIYKKYINVPCSSGLSGNQFAAKVIYLLNLNVKLGVNDAFLCDAYSYKHRMLIMSREVCDKASIASIAITAHELGHALQHHTNSANFALWIIWSRINRFTKKLILPVLLIGLGVLLFGSMSTGINILWTALALFIFHICDKIIVIPLEYNASRRAMKFLKEHNFITKSEYGIAKRILSVAALTYVASLFDGIIIFGHKLNRFTKK